ncbi:hemolysin family protein [Bdellovibrio svalbardensis]|uniref:Hemolysin family protein n=1 Tax=Bdellovibrio svalbardensis TaxID=2972972 RepID=A0ABT6DIN4_9BACT|nr:hemolysin family protein [Bdellovibrio svalbardensis]MDG0816384.1 hemolysin family protein [Bdellovibrio svalbardensis]
MTELLIVILCLFINMLLSGAEMAFVTVRKMQLKTISSKDKRAKILLLLKENPERTLSVIQIGITLVGAIAAAVGGAGAEEALTPTLMNQFALKEQTAEALSIALVVLPISYLSVVVGELVPKTLALRNSLAISLWSARALFLGEKLLSPAVWILEKSTNLILKIFSLTNTTEQRHEHDLEIEDLPHQTKQYLINLVSADKMLARDVMLPWSEVIFVRKTDLIEDVETIIVNSGHTRIPVLEDENVIGLINSKEFFVARKYKDNEWQSLIRPCLKFKSFEPLFRILLKMQEEKSHLAVIYDRAQIVGLLTMENIFEEIIGDVFDEDDDGYVKKLLASKSRRRP